MRASDICDVFDNVWDENDEKSTEWLLAMTADRCGVPYDRVVDALQCRATREKSNG